jgi:hypothetical protein
MPHSPTSPRTPDIHISSSRQREVLGQGGAAGGAAEDEARVEGDHEEDDAGGAGRCLAPQLAINLGPVPDADDQNDDGSFVNLVEDAVVANAEAIKRLRASSPCGRGFAARLSMRRASRL